jgi:hypothetical protein
MRLSRRPTRYFGIVIEYVIWPIWSNLVDHVDTITGSNLRPLGRQGMRTARKISTVVGHMVQMRTILGHGESLFWRRQRTAPACRSRLSCLWHRRSRVSETDPSCAPAAALVPPH